MYLKFTILSRKKVERIVNELTQTQIYMGIRSAHAHKPHKLKFVTNKIDYCFNVGACTTKLPKIYCTINCQSNDNKKKAAHVTAWNRFNNIK